MSMDRQATGLVVIRVTLGVFYLAEGLGKWRWLVDPSTLAARFHGWQAAAAPGSWSAQYLEHIAVPGAALFARLVPLGELAAGTALILGVWTPLAALLAFLIVPWGGMVTIAGPELGNTPSILTVEAEAKATSKK